MLLKKKIPGQKGYEYFPTDPSQQLLPIIRSIGDWGLTWAQSNLMEQDYDIELLMLYIKRSIVAEKLVGRETLLQFSFTDIERYPKWWIQIKGQEVELCDKDFGREVDVYFTSTVKQLSHIFMGNISYQQGIAEGQLTVVGNATLIRSMNSWLKGSLLRKIPSQTEY